MINDQAQKEFTLYPSWKYYFFSYIFSVLAIPLAGIGLIALYYLKKKHRSFRYIIQDDKIASIDQMYEQHIDVIDIQQIELRCSRFQEFLGIGTLVLDTPSATMEITGISDPENIKDILERAIFIQNKQKEAQPKPVKTEPAYKPGAREKINYLTGLWQQGLLSDQDYREQLQQYE